MDKNNMIEIIISNDIDTILKAVENLIFNIIEIE